MSFNLLVLFMLIKLVIANISIEVKVDINNNITIAYSGKEVDVITNEDIKLFKINNANLKDAIKQYYGRQPNDIYLKSPTPWNDLYKTYKWQEVSRVLSIKSATVTGISLKPVIVLSQDFENLSQQTIKVNTGITHTVENTLTTSWSLNKEMTVSQDISYNVNIIFAKIEGSTGFSYTSNWGVSQVKSETVSIGTNSGMETELKPGQAVTSVLSANAGYLEIKVVYTASLRGMVAVNYKTPLNGHHFWGPSIKTIMRRAGLRNEVTATETIKFGFHVDASLKVYDKATGLPI